MRALLKSAQTATDERGEVMLPGQVETVNFKHSRSKLAANKKMASVMARFQKYQSGRMKEEQRRAQGVKRVYELTVVQKAVKKAVLLREQRARTAQENFALMGAKAEKVFVVTSLRDKLVLPEQFKLVRSLLEADLVVSPNLLEYSNITMGDQELSSHTMAVIARGMRAVTPKFFEHPCDLATIKQNATSIKFKAPIGKTKVLFCTERFQRKYGDCIMKIIQCVSSQPNPKWKLVDSEAAFAATLAAGKAASRLDRSSDAYVEFKRVAAVDRLSSPVGAYGVCS